MTPKISQKLSLGTFLPLGYAVELRKSVVTLCGTMWFPHIDTAVDLAAKRNKIDGLCQECLGTAFQGFPPRTVIAVGGDHDDWDVRSCCLGPRQ